MTPNPHARTLRYPVPAHLTAALVAAAQTAAQTGVTRDGNHAVVLDCAGLVTFDPDAIPALAIVAASVRALLASVHVYDIPVELANQIVSADRTVLAAFHSYSVR